MRGFQSRTRVPDALAWLDSQIAAPPSEVVNVAESCQRVLAADVISDINVPTFRRAMMDGYALLATDTEGASTYNPINLKVIGEALPGRPFAGRVEPGFAVRVMTGAPLPLGADAVLPAEQATESNAGVTLHGESTPEKHVGRVGEDVEQGATVLSAGRVLRPQDIGVLASIGKSSVSVCRQPRVRILITGNELLTAGASPQSGHIFDANGPMLRGLVERDGGLPIFPGIVPDDPDAIAEQLQTDYDIALVSGGSSVGKEDYAPRLVSELGSLPIHGVAMRPSSPAGMGLIQSKLVILLPGNPVSCLCAYDFFAGRTIRQLGGRSAAWPYRRTKTRLSRKLVSTVGRVDYARVKFVNNEAEPIAISGASILTSTTRADGFVIIEEDSEGYPGGAEVTVWRYDV